MISPICSETAPRDGNRRGHGHEEASPVTHEWYETTYRALNARAQAYLDKLPACDPLVRANALIDAAVACDDTGDHEAAAILADAAEALLAGETA
jgi:hypothetical protein